MILIGNCAQVSGRSNYLKTQYYEQENISKCRSRLLPVELVTVLRAGNLKKKRKNCQNGIVAWPVLYHRHRTRRDLHFGLFFSSQRCVLRKLRAGPVCKYALSFIWSSEWMIPEFKMFHLFYTYFPSCFSSNLCFQNTTAFYNKLFTLERKIDSMDIPTTSKIRLICETAELEDYKYVEKPKAPKSHCVITEIYWW